MKEGGDRVALQVLLEPFFMPQSSKKLLKIQDLANVQGTSGTDKAVFPGAPPAFASGVAVLILSKGYGDGYHRGMHQLRGL